MSHINIKHLQTSPQMDSKKSLTSAWVTCSDQHIHHKFCVPKMIINHHKRWCLSQNYLLINVCAINSPCTHFSFIFRLESTIQAFKMKGNKLSAWLSSALNFWDCPLARILHITRTELITEILTRGKKVELTGAIAVFEGSTLTG